MTPTPETVRAAGALCWRTRADGAAEVLLVHSARWGDWSWPKGKPDDDREPLPVCAVREIAEEAGAVVRLGRPLPGARYRLPDGRPKEVTYWAGRVLSEGTPTAGPDEIDDRGWFGIEEARARLTRPGDHGPLDRLLHLLDRGTLDTFALLVVRHAVAVAREDWTDTDPDRPLDATGREQAAALVPLLACWRPAGLLTSPWRRCAGTLEPYAASEQALLVDAPELTEDAALEEPEAAVRLVRELLAAGTDRALCTHRPVLPAVITALHEAAVPRVRRELPGENPWLRKGEVLVLHVGRHDGRIRDAERFLP